VSTRTPFTRPFLTRYRRVYNTLIDVDVAYARLRRNRRQLPAIQAALRVIAEHRVRSFLGVTLLHRHFRAEPNAVFVERRFTPRPGSATAVIPRIATSARPDPREEAHRWRWIP
jgi:hypothetical protein